MVTAGAAVAMALVAGTIVSSWQAIEANRARNAERSQRLCRQAAQSGAEQSQQAEQQLAYRRIASSTWPT